MPSFIEVASSYVPQEVFRNPYRRASAYDFSASKAIQLRGGFKDILIVGEPKGWHEKQMRAVHIGSGIPESNLVTHEEFLGYKQEGNLGLTSLLSDEYTVLRDRTRVVHIALFEPFKKEEDVPRIRALDKVFVPGAGNINHSEVFGEGRDLYDVNNAHWNKGPYIKKYQDILAVYSTGKVLAATSAVVTKANTIEPFKGVLMCGDIQEHCFTVIPGQYTSSASARLAGMSFYLAQFYPTTDEVIETLKECAVDIGEEGIDREYGRGVANVLCPRVLKKELEVVSGFFGEEERQEREGHTALERSFWKADTLEVYLPLLLAETLSSEIKGSIAGHLEVFEGNRVEADFTMEAEISTAFLIPIEAIAKESVQGEGGYTEAVLSFQEDKEYAYQIQDTNLYLTKSLTLNEALRLLPGRFQDIVNQEKNSEDWFTNNPIEITAVFKRDPLLVGDFDRNNVVDFADFLLFTAVFGTNTADHNFNKSMDLIPDGMITFADFLVFVENFGKTA